METTEVVDFEVFFSFPSLTRSAAHHAGVVVRLLRRVHQVEPGQVRRESLGAVYQHLLQAGQVLRTEKYDTYIIYYIYVCVC